MAKKKLTQARVEHAPKPTSGQTFLWDTVVTGFGVRILPSGKKTFWFQYRPRGGKSRMVRIGTFRDISVDKARDAAHAYAGEVALGGNPAADLKAERMRDKVTLRALLAEGGDYPRTLENHRLVNIKPVLSSLRRGLHGLMSAEVTHLTRRDFIRAIDAVEADRGPGAANDLRRFSRTFLEWCVSTDRAPHNVLAGYRRPGKTRAERLAAASNGGRALNDDEIRKLWHAAGAERFGSFGALVRLGLLTGLRRGELAQIERERDVRADRIVVQPEHAKTGAEHAVPLTPLMHAVIDGAPVTTSKLLFPAARGRRIKAWTKRIVDLRQASGVDFRLHDLRRTTRTLMSKLRVPEDIAEPAIGHVRADLVRRYNKDEAWEGRSDAFAKVSAHVETLIGERPGAAVIPLRG